MEILAESLATKISPIATRSRTTRRADYMSLLQYFLHFYQIRWPPILWPMLQAVRYRGANFVLP